LGKSQLMDKFVVNLSKIQTVGNQIINSLIFVNRSIWRNLMNTKKLPQENHFWDKPKETLKINEFRLRKFLESHRFGLYQMGDKRTSSKEVFKNDSGILKIHNEESVKTWLLDYLESTPEKEFDSGKFQNKTIQVTEGQSIKWDVLAKVQSYDKSRLKNVLYTLPKYSEIGYSDTTKLELFDDTAKTAHIRFKNGIVRITTDEMKIIPYKDLKDKGATWESAIIPREIKLNDEKGLFETFTEKAMSRKSHSKNNEDWTMNYDLDRDQYLSLRTSYGYLIHTHNTPDVSKCVYYIDCDSDIGRPEGGNGKSVVMESVKHFKQLVNVDGKSFRQNMDGGGRFQFSMVTADTRLIMIDDIRPEFNFDMLFSKITGDMEIERKGRDIVIIPKDRKPKIALTTNYVIAGVGTSYQRRQHIVEFGNYWNYCNGVKESPADSKHLGKMLFSDFNDDDWNQFYTYGFKCIQDYFKLGLVESPKQNHLEKSRKMEVEGIHGDGVPTQWMKDWLENDRQKGNYHIGDGICAKELYKKFAHDNLTYTPEGGGSWDSKRFDDALWKYVDLHPDYEYNPQLSRKGNKKTDRRSLKGSAGKQTPHIKITSPKDILDTLSK
jgi:hypothetical protein